MRLHGRPTVAEAGQALLWYPVVGGLIGLVLIVLMQTLPASKTLADAALMVVAWVVMTGGLHLEGLGDTADAWAGGHGDRERTLAIMKDPRAGPMAVVAIALVLLLKFASLTVLLASGACGPVLVAPILGRAAMPLLLATTPYVRADGIGAEAAAALPRRPAIVIVATVLLGVLAGLHLPGLVILAGSAAVFVAARVSFRQRLGGVTGDCCGALLELVEAAALLAGALST